MTTISAREFSQDVSAVKRQAADGPVVITDRGALAFVLLTIDDYRRLSSVEQDFMSRLRMKDGDDIEFKECG